MNNDLKINFVSYQRLLNTSVRLLESVEGGLTKGEIHTLKYIFSQLDDKQQSFILNKYDNDLWFLHDEIEERGSII